MMTDDMISMVAKVVRHDEGEGMERSLGATCLLLFFSFPHGVFNSRH